MNRHLLLMGVSGSGKSTVGALLGQALEIPFAEPDAFHPQANIEKMARGEPLTDDDRLPWLDALGAWLAARPQGGIIGCSALRRAYRDRLRGRVPDLRLLHLTGEPAMIAARQAARAGHFMPPQLMASQLATLEAPAADERPILLDITQPPDALVAYALTQLKETP